MALERKDRHPKGAMFNMIAIMFVCVVFIIMLAEQLTVSLLFQPPEASYGETDGVIFLPREDGETIAAFWGEAPGAKQTVFYFHGNAEDLGHIRGFLNTYRLNGFNVFSFDYRGYGLTPGDPAEYNLYQDALTAFDYLTSELGVDPKSVILHGRSLGGAPAIHVADNREVGALVAESTFRSAHKLSLPMHWIPGDKFRNEKKIAKLSLPILLIHGMQDEVVPFSHAKGLEEAIETSMLETYWVESAGHNDLVAREGVAYWHRIRAFAGKIADLELSDSGEAALKEASLVILRDY
ncbi:alpha/beta hydrolase [Puniceicoccaceae bacterium K14]|nr:alpha/beta hydrolase [Puniceicoccaceae bacterium K14]